MKLFDTDIVIQRGEGFQLNFEILTPQETPYIIPADINNPYFVLTVTSSGNYTDGRYKKDWWMKVDDTTPRFYGFGELIAMDIRKFYSDPNDPESAVYDDWDSVQNLDSFSGHYYPGYDGIFRLDSKSWRNHVYSEHVFYGPDSTGKIVYKYWYSSEDDDVIGGWKDYDLILSFIIMPSDSQEWISQNYLYGVSLQAGVSTEEAYNAFKEVDDPPFTDVVVNNVVIESGVYGHSYDYILTNYPDLASRLLQEEKLLENITDSIPLYSLDYVVPIVEPSKLTVNTNLKGGILQ